MTCTSSRRNERKSSCDPAFYYTLKIQKYAGLIVIDCTLHLKTQHQPLVERTTELDVTSQNAFQTAPHTPKRSFKQHTTPLLILRSPLHNNPDAVSSGRAC